MSSFSAFSISLAIVTLVVSVCLASSTTAGTLTLADSDYFPNSQILHLEGEIVSKDAREIEALIRRKTEADDFPLRVLGRLFVLSLNSDGGDLNSALKIVELVRKYNLTTYIGPGNECLSSCAYIFMAGKRSWRLGGAETARVMDVTAGLGFHSPFVRGSDGDFLAGVDSIQKILSVGEDLPVDLFLNSLKYRGPNRFLVVDTVREAYENNIQLSGIEYVTHPSGSGETLCRNLADIQGTMLGQIVDPSVFTEDGRNEYFAKNPAMAESSAEFERIEAVSKSAALNELIFLNATEGLSDSYVYHAYFFGQRSVDEAAETNDGTAGNPIEFLCHANLGYNAVNRIHWGGRRAPETHNAHSVTGEIFDMTEFGPTTVITEPYSIAQRLRHSYDDLPYWFAFPFDTKIATFSKGQVETDAVNEILKVSYPYIGMFNDFIIGSDFVQPID